MLKFYGDESGDSEAGVLRVSGYLMSDDQFDLWDIGIKSALNGELPYFHMCEGHHVEHPDIYQALVKLIVPPSFADSVLVGFDVSLIEQEYDEITSPFRRTGQTLKYYLGGPYSFLLQMIMGRCGEWTSLHRPQDEYVAYFFEGGHPRQGEADFFIGQMGSYPPRPQKDRSRYASHTFIPKYGPLGYLFSPCDMLAWHLTHWQRGGLQPPELTSMLQVQTIPRPFSRNDIQHSVDDQIRYWQTLDRKGRP